MNDGEARWSPVTSTFRPHDTEMIDVWCLGQIRFKVYAITSVGSMDPGLLETSRRLCADIEDDQAHGVGWITIHQTATVCYTFANWWCQESIVRRRGWVAPGDLPAALRQITDDVTTCVWEIPLEVAERDAWVRTMMSGSNDIAAYLGVDGSNVGPEEVPMPDDETPTDANRDGEAHDEVDRSVRREAAERAATPDPLEGDDRLPPGHPAQADDSFSVGEAINDDDLPADTGRPGRSADTT